MGTNNWTPGPWKVNKYGSIGAGPLGHTPVVAYAEPFYGDDKRDGDSSANAQMIAAAPELYEALHEILDLGLHQIPPEDHNRAVRALRKARGES